MWILSLEWLLLAVGVFWMIGACKRLQRLKLSGKAAFAPVDEQLQLMLELLRSCARSEPPATAQDFALEHARQALFPQANLLEVALQNTRQQPLQAQTMDALNHAWLSLNAAWDAFADLRARMRQETADADDWSLRWKQMYSVQSHCSEQFNDAVNHYNRAITQFPACGLARILGLKPGRIFQKDAAFPMQPNA